jgi:hypothetical protein
MTKQVYKITYPTGKIYVGKDSIGSCRYFGSPNMDIVNEDFLLLPEAQRKDYFIRKQILWESDTATEEELSAMERSNRTRADRPPTCKPACVVMRQRCTVCRS